MTSDQGAELIQWARLLWVTQLALGVVLIVALVALTVTMLWRAG